MQVKIENYKMNPPANSRGIFCFGLFFLILFSVFPGKAQPRLTISEPKQNFERVKKGEVVKLLYQVINSGNQPLHLEAAEVTCDCTSANFQKEPVLPGATVTVTVTFDTKGAYGRQDRIVELFSNDPKSPHRLRFKGTVESK